MSAYVRAESVTVDCDEGRTTLEIEDVDGVRVTVDIHGIDLDAFYDQVRGRIGPYLREMHEARDAVARGVTLNAFLCRPEDVDESGGVEGISERMDRLAREDTMTDEGVVVAIREDGSYRVEPDEDAYDPTDPKHPRFHSIHADVYDNREGK